MSDTRAKFWNRIEPSNTPAQYTYLMSAQAWFFELLRDAAADLTSESRWNFSDYRAFVTVHNRYEGGVKQFVTDLGGF